MSDGRGAEIALNRALWAVVNDRFTDAAADAMWGRPEAVWGLFAVPERSLGVLGDVRGLDVAELACGTAYVSAWLARAGARPVALDLSGEQLATARRLQRTVGPDFPLVQADAEHLPLASRCVDLVVSEHGAAAWCDPARWLPEAARVLRPGGRLLLTVPFLSRLHEEPHDFYRYTEHGLRELLGRHGFVVEEVAPIASVCSFLGHQVSTLVVAGTWDVPVLRELAFGVNLLAV
ncbi:MAG TPA: class I SAM-dependent methyltransferase, partial [Ornithinibacter sp.]|nr:class I SAM-dependent methyltransferase [Ornithinibacter sp.]